MFKCNNGTTTYQEENIINKVSFGKFAREKLNIKEVFVVHELMSGFSVTETAKRLNMSRRYCTMIISDIRTKYKKYLN